MEKSGVYNFTESLQRKILAALWRDQHAFNLYRDVVKPKYFQDSVLIDICRILFNYYDKYNQVPTLDVLSQEVAELCRRTRRKELILNKYQETLEFMSEITLDDLDYLKDKIIAFGKRQALIDSIMEATVILDKEPEAQYPKIQSLIKDALMVGENVYDLGTNIYDNIEERFLSYLNDDDVIERIPTGIHALDTCLGGGLGRTEMGIVVAAPGLGKSLEENTPVLTPQGYRPIKDLQIGDKVISVDGKPTTVTAIYRHYNKSLYRVKFMYGGECVCCDEHLWTVRTKNMRRKPQCRHQWITLPLKDMISNLKAWNVGYNNYNIPVMTNPCELEPQGEITLNPWLLGVLIGDGSLSIPTAFSFTNVETDILHRVNDLLKDLGMQLVPVIGDKDHRITLLDKSNMGKSKKSALRMELEKLNLVGKKSYEKFIPKSYLFSSPENRLLLLQGLLDTDGWVQSKYSVEYSTTSEQLMQDVKFLAESLGCVTSKIYSKMGSYAKNGKRHYTRTQYRIVIRPINGVQIVSSQKHLAKMDLSKLPNRFIESVEYVGVKPSICLTVDHPSQLYVIKDAIVTHNTSTLVSIGGAAIENGYNVLHVSLENNEKQITRNYDLRLLKHNIEYVRENVEQSIQAMFNIQKFRRGELRIKKYPTRGATVQTIRTLLDRYKLVQGFIPDVLIVDYGTILKSSVNYMDKRNAIESNFEELRALADDYNVGLWTAAQGNRGALSKKVVTMGDLAECFAIGNICDVMTCLCQTMQEKAKQELRMFLPKIRDNADKMILKGRIMYDIKKVEMDEIVSADDQGSEDKEEEVADWDAEKSKE